MMLSKACIFAVVLFVCPAACLAQNWPAPKAPAIAEADGYVVIPNAAIPPDPKMAYRTIFDGTRFPEKPDSILPVVNAAGGLLNDLAVGQVPRGNIQFVIVFHGPGLDGILDDAHYRQKYGIANPNLPALAEMKKQGVTLLVCGQHLAADHIDPKILTPLVTIASDAYLVLVTYQDRGYALMSF